MSHGASEALKGSWARPSPLAVSLKLYQVYRADRGVGSCALRGLVLGWLLCMSSLQRGTVAHLLVHLAGHPALLASRPLGSSSQAVNAQGWHLRVQFPLGQVGPVGNGGLQTLQLASVTFGLLNQPGPHQARPCFEVGCWTSRVVGELCK